MELALKFVIGRLQHLYSSRKANSREANQLEIWIAGQAESRPELIEGAKRYIGKRRARFLNGFTKYPQVFTQK